MSSFGSWLSAPLLRYVHKEEDVSALRLYLFFNMLLLQSWRFRQVIPDFLWALFILMEKPLSYKPPVIQLNIGKVLYKH